MKIYVIYGSRLWKLELSLHAFNWFGLFVWRFCNIISDFCWFLRWCRFGNNLERLWESFCGIAWFSRLIRWTQILKMVKLSSEIKILSLTLIEFLKLASQTLQLNMKNSFLSNRMIKLSCFKILLNWFRFKNCTDNFISVQTIIQNLFLTEQMRLLKSPNSVDLNFSTKKI